MDGKNKSRTCKRDNSRLLDTAFKTKPIKERTKRLFLISQMHINTQKTLLNMSFFTNAATNFNIYPHSYQSIYHSSPELLATI